MPFPSPLSSILPPVVKTTVEGKLKMEKTVGSHLMRCDHQIAKAYTVRDTTTHYRIRTIIGGLAVLIETLFGNLGFPGKRQLLIEERTKVDAGDGRGPPTVRSTGTYRLSVYEDGKEVAGNGIYNKSRNKFASFKKCNICISCTKLNCII
jgi:hypothetical protein